MADTERPKSLMLSDMQYCEIGKKIVELQGNEAITDDAGHLTELYWHVARCDECIG